MAICENLPDLPAALRGLITEIPPGRVATCGGLATALGDLRASRWIGHFLLHHEHSPPCPCHRVVRVKGLLGGFVQGGATIKKDLLLREGIRISAESIDLQRYGFAEFSTSQPLVQLRQEQERLQRKWRERRWRRLPQRIGGIDVSYSRRGEAVASYTVVEVDTGELVWSTTIATPVSFPYIPTYLTFRELPALLAAVDAARQAGSLAELTLVDGTGILHPRRLGIASHLGIVAQIATVGVTKSLLCGRVEGKPRLGTPAPVFCDDALLGMAIIPTHDRAPLYVSAGQGVDLETALAAVAGTLRGRRLPEPIYWADRLSRSAARAGSVAAVR
ncbi:MAG: endonuclease V [Planctomycetaceae bacterium]|nr:endonuclease V [Planctomycetaceae bacterium]